MSDETKPTTPVPPGTGTSPGGGRMVFTMGAIGLLAGILIVLTYQLTFPVIKHNKAVALEKAIFEVVPGAASKQTFYQDGTELKVLEGENDAVRKYYAAYGEDGQLAGIAVEAAGQGFQDILRVLYGYSPECNCIVGMKVLESKETPGLGDKIETDPDFRANFEALAVTLAGNGQDIADPIVMVKHGEKSNAWEVEAITGATISSRAIAAILRESSAEVIPAIERNIDFLEEGAP